MLKPNEIERFSFILQPQLHKLENQIMADIVRRLKINGEITRSADWQIFRLSELGVAQKEIENNLKNSLNFNDEDIKNLYDDIIQKDYARDANLYKAAGLKQKEFKDNLWLQQLINTIAIQTTGELKNITQSMGFSVKNLDGSLSFLPIAEYYQNTLDNAVLGISSGAFDYNTVLKKTVAEMTSSGLRTIEYASGWTNRTDVAVRRAIMTGLSQITANISDSNAEELGTDMFEVTWHSGARPTHQTWQGGWYTKKQLETICGLGTGPGLCGWNCYHNYYPVIPGISTPTYTKEQLKEMNREENKQTEYNGKAYTKYQALQRQRNLETTMRAQRQKIKLLEEGGAAENDIIAARCRYRGTSQEYTEFSKAMGLPQQRERVTIDGLGNIGVGKYKT